MGLTFWDSITKRNKDVTDTTPLPVGAGALGEAWEGDPDHIFGEYGTVNGRLFTLLSAVGTLQATYSEQGVVYPSNGGLLTYRKADSYSWGITADGPAVGGPIGVVNGVGGAACVAIQVIGTNSSGGTAVALTDWDIRLEATLDASFYDEIGSHKTPDGAGKIKVFSPVCFSHYRYRIVSLTRGAASRCRIAVLVR